MPPHSWGYRSYATYPTDFTKFLKKSLQQCFSNCSTELKEETLPDLFYMASITLLPKFNKDTTKNYTPTFLMQKFSAKY
jgi:hypothetical protein